MLTTLWQDILYGARMLLKKPGFTAIAALSLALGIGANTAIFGLINTVLLGPLPYRDLDRLVMLWSVPPQDPKGNDGATVPDFLAWRDRSQSFEVMGAMSGGSVDFGSEQDGNPAERIQGEEFNSELFQTLGVQPSLGRFVAPTEDEIDTPAPVIVISQRLWQRRFA